MPHFQLIALWESHGFVSNFYFWHFFCKWNRHTWDDVHSAFFIEQKQNNFHIIAEHSHITNTEVWRLHQLFARGCMSSAVCRNNNSSSRVWCLFYARVIPWSQLSGLNKKKTHSLENSQVQGL